MPLLPTTVVPSTRGKRARSRNSGSSCKALIAVFLTVALLAGIAWKQTSNISAPGDESRAGATPGRRDLTEKTNSVTALTRSSSTGHNRPSSSFVQTFPATSNINRVLLSSHGRLIWYKYDTDELQILHEGQGVYYGVFPGEEVDEQGNPTTLWVVSRPHNWRPTTSQEWLFHIDITTGEELKRVSIKSKFTHDTIRTGRNVYISNTGEGIVVEMSFPELKEVRKMSLFTLEEHINTLAPSGNGTLWAMLHNLGPSILAEIDLATGQELRRLKNIGVKSHGLVHWQGSIIALDSDNSALMQVDATNGAVTRLWKLDDAGYFFKGLCIVDDIAFFGMAKQQPRQQRDSPDLDCELGAYDLKEKVLLWRRILPTHGLLNIVSAPHLAVESTSFALYPDASGGLYRRSQAYKDALENAKAMLIPSEQTNELQGQANTEPLHLAKVDDELDTQQHQEQEPAAIAMGSGDDGKAYDVIVAPAPKLPAGDPVLKYPPLLGGTWASGVPRLDLSSKTMQGMAGGVQLLLFAADVSKIKEALLALDDEDWSDAVQREKNAFLEGRSANLNQFKPGTGTIHLLFSDQDGMNVFSFPWYRNKFGKLLDPLLQKVLGDDITNIIRLQFARMPPGGEIKRHVDTGGYSQQGHRIHLVVYSNPEVMFLVCEQEKCVPIHVEEGLIFELNNRLAHSVRNGGTEPRVHLVIDVAESPRRRKELRVGEVCQYANGTIECEE